MAKWGEGDPRWIVEERADGKNVKNWHWTEKNATSWSIEQLNNLLLTVRIKDTDCKGKTGDEITGTVEVYLGEEYTIEETEIKVSCSSSTPVAEALKQLVKTKGVEEIRTKLAQYLKLLKGEETNNSTSTGNQPNAAPDSKTTYDVKESIKAPRDLSVNVLSFQEEFFCTPDDLYRVLTTKDLVQAFTHDAAVVDATANGEYRIFGGNITGIFDSLDPGKVIKMRWRKDNWAVDHYSNLTLQFSPFQGGTRMELTQTNVPNYDLENTKNGWRENFFFGVKLTFGYGTNLYM